MVNNNSYISKIHACSVLGNILSMLNVLSHFILKQLHYVVKNLTLSPKRSGLCPWLLKGDSFLSPWNILPDKRIFVYLGGFGATSKSLRMRFMVFALSPIYGACFESCGYRLDLRRGWILRAAM